MATKLTLSIDKRVIEKAKRFAKRSNRSLSDIIETYLTRITSTDIDDSDSELSEILGVIELPEDFDEKEEIRNIRIKKHQG
jgi:hypothetical protein